ncbi:hypothetical protein Vadar_003466 [Vaccinium darrowii]|uniref:Uncharacterized protein n=1 Tax=Vaccinium darrowii TaxID=229202 RepID=A0ACB7YT31_9ERIC|nr:hypothetical protein Vadar_003466 [Vaccinium darrowii]
MNRSIFIVDKKKHKFSIPYLPTHIIIDILSRLPLKTLLDCQLVCKDWLSLISDLHFAKVHLSRSPVSILIKPTHHHRRKIRLIDVGLQTLPNTHPLDAQLTFNPKTHYPIIGDRIVNSCNGLILSNDISEPVFVSNPIVGEFVTIPRSYGDGRFDGATSALGFCPLTNKYKVIQFFLKSVSFDPITGLKIYGEEAEAEIYTLGQAPWPGIWRKLGRVPYHLSKHSFNSSMNGVLYWLTSTPDSPGFIRCFDFGSERFRAVPEPPEFDLENNAGLHHLSLGVLRDRLSICDYSSPRHVDIWIMKDINTKESWCKEFVIKNVIVNRQPLNYCEPIMILKSGEILMLVNRNALVQYYPKLGIFKILHIYGIGIKSEVYATAHIPSFVSPAEVAKGQRFTAYWKPRRSEILNKMFELMKSQSSGQTVNKPLQFCRRPMDVSVEDCLLKLKMLPGITPGDPLHMFGTMILDRPDARKEFMGLPSDEIRVAWLEKMR